VKFSKYLEKAQEMRKKYPHLGTLYILTDDPAVAEGLDAGVYETSGFKVVTQAMDRSKYDGPGMFTLSLKPIRLTFLMNCREPK
jgi:hypothetical protein